MRMILMLVATLASEMAHAELFNDLRELRGTIYETSRTAKEVNELGKTLAPESKHKLEIPAQSTGLKSGEAMRSKLGKLKLLSEPSKKAHSLGQLSKADDMIFMGEEKDGFYLVSTINGEGWVDKLLVQKR